MTGTFFGEALSYGGIVFKLLLIAKLWRLRLLKQYPVLVTYLLFSLARSAANAYLLQTQARLFGLSGYNLLYVVSQPVLWVLYFLLILELYSLMLRDFTGIRRLGRLILFSSLAGTTLACCAVMALDRREGAFQYPFMAYWVLQERSVFFCLSALTVLLVLFVCHFQLPVARNVWILCGSFGGYFILYSLLLVQWRYLGDGFRFIRDLLNGLFFFVALLAPVVCLSKAGESQAQLIGIFRRRRTEELELALLSRLRGLDRALGELLKA